MPPDQTLNALDSIAVGLAVLLVMFGIATAICGLVILLGCIACWAGEKREEYAGWDWRDVRSRAIQDVAWRVISRCVKGEERRCLERRDRAKAEVDLLLAIPHPGEWPSWPEKEGAA